MSTLLALLLSFAHAAEPPTCDALPAPRSERVSVAWVAPAGAHVGVSGWLTVVEQNRLRSWVDAEGADLARLLQGLGRRKSPKRPSRPWVVAIFEVDVDALCRPVAAPEAPADVAGVAVCDRQDKGVTGKHAGCGYTVDRADGRRGLDVYRIRWKDAAATGFCVLPADRWLTQR